MPRRSISFITAVLLTLAVTVVPATSAMGQPAAQPSPEVYQGTIDGARYRVVVPQDWNGTLLLYSHGAYLPEYPPGERIALTNHPRTEQWLLEHGFALAASRYSKVFGWLVVESGLADQRALLEWFTRNVGSPERTISYGSSVGGLIAVLLAERHPRLFDGVLSLCGNLAGSVAKFNTELDLAYAVKTLLAPQSDLELVNISEPEANKAAFRRIIQSAMNSGDPAERARLALSLALADVTGWYTSRHRPDTTAGRLLHAYTYAYYIHAPFLGRIRADIERRAGGNPSWNVGIDYREQFTRSSMRELVRTMYEQAGLDLGADLARLNSGPRITPDLAASAYLARYGFPLGLTPVPVVTIHSVGDGTLPVSNQRSYTRQVRRFGEPGMVRQLYVDRGYHCSFTASEEIAALRTLLRRVDTGQWPVTTPTALNSAAARLGAEYHTVWGWEPTAGYHPHEPSFITYQPDLYQRPFPLVRP